MTRPAPVAHKNPEEEHFFRVNQDLIREYRQRLDQERRTLERQQSRQTHWLKCPKCGGDMQTNQVAGIAADQCQDCRGVFFDAGEMDLLLHSRESESFLDSLRIRMERSLNEKKEWQVPSH